MALFNWDNSYSIGIQSIDAQHKKLIEIVNELHEAMQTGRGKDVLGKILDRLIEYTENHFSHEEKIFETHNYPDRFGHHQEHQALLEKVSELQKKFLADSFLLTVETMIFLRDWVAKHILESDKRYVSFLQNCGVK